MLKLAGSFLNKICYLQRFFKPVELKNTSIFYGHSKADIRPDIAYHGSPFRFNTFDYSKIGQGEGCSKRGRGIYLYRTKKYAPYFANLRSADAPIHIGTTAKLDNPKPTVYTVGLNKLNLKKVNAQEAKQIARNQTEFEKMYPDFDGIELPTTEICIFPKSVEKLNILKKQTLKNFVKENKGYNFRQWTKNGL